MWPLLSSGQELGTENGRNNEFMTVFSHELRNSLGAIRSAARILRMETSAGPPAVKARVLIERQVGQMTRLVEDLLDVSRVRSGQLRLQCERIDLRAVAAHAAQTVEFTMQQRNHRMTTSFPDAPVWLQADPARLEQVFVNLLLNAAKYTDAGGEVGLSVEREKGEAIVRIRDSGIGIDPECPAARVRSLRPGGSVIAARGRGPRYRTRLGAQSGRAPWWPRHRGKRWPRARKRVHGSPTNTSGVVLVIGGMARRRSVNQTKRGDADRRTHAFGAPMTVPDTGSTHMSRSWTALTPGVFSATTRKPTRS